jgi:uncharacterized membrane protein
MRKVIIVALFVSLYNSSFSQLYFRNNYTQPVTIAIAYYSDGKDAKEWVSFGWITIEPNERKEILSGVPLNGYVYYYATCNNGKIFDGQHPFIINPFKGFEIKNANMEYVLKENANYKFVNFREVSMGLRSLSLKYTIDFYY